ncbi:sensor histidine kinase [Streptosporangium minutum]|uniref:histidine kinase n=1 Tax=Streptosporangium minutum TaxID=569862 RepID=A0A243RX20_9ACTN|nr:ATP-binding protein [Streptosporangium minutum]OUC99730.1 two-component sensor histidine kinase [Streptosporangium minutum]
MSRLSVRVRATLAATAIVAVALGVAAVVLVGVLKGSLVDSASAEAARRAYGTADMITASPGIIAGRVTDPLDPDVQVIEEADLSEAEWRAALAQPAQAALPITSGPDTPWTGTTRSDTTRSTASRGETTRSDAVRPETTGPAAVHAERWAPAGSFTVATMPVSTVEGVVLVQARASLEPTSAALQTLQGLLIPGIPGLLLLVAALTWLAVGRALAPVSAIRTEMADITASDLHRRVPVPRSRDEIARLAETMNRTLDRLELAVDRHKRFVADAAHELRSPLAILRTRLELAPPGPLAAEALTDVERIQALTSDLLLLARLDAGEPACHGEVDLGQVAAEEATRSRPRPEIRVELEVAADVVVRGSAEELRRLVANLVDNAVRHADSTVTVRLARDGGGAVLDVRDDGPGIPAEHREAVFDRFTRLDEARDRDAGGSGLGLAIARDIAVRHGGGLSVVGEGPGARLRARLPSP